MDTLISISVVLFPVLLAGLLLYLLMIWVAGKLLSLTTSSIGAVAKITFDQAVRMRVAVVVFALLVILLPLMSKIMVGDGTLLGKMQTFTSYGLGLISFLLSILTIAISTFTLSNDLKRKSIFLVLTKPVRRFELILGKLLGILLINAMLLVLFGSVLYACTLAVYRYADVSDEEMARVQNQFFTARIGLKPTIDMEPLYKKAQERYLAMEENNQLPEGMSASRIMRQLQGQEIMKVKAVAPGRDKTWDFENVRIKSAEDSETVLFVRYKLDVTITPPNEQVLGTWAVGDLRQYRAGGEVKTPVYPWESYGPIKTKREFEVPASVIAEDGYLGVGFFNSPAANRTTIIPEDLEILYETGTFTGNYIRAILLILVHLAFLTILGVALSTWLSFPVAILVCLVAFFAGLTNTFIMDAIAGMSSGLGLFYAFAVKPLLWLLPQFDGLHNPNGYIVDGRTLQWTFLATTAGITVFVKGLLILLVGMLIFSRREVAKAVV